MLLSVSLLLLSLSISYLFALKQIYQLQLSEYRLDRFRVMMRDSGIGNFFKPKVVYPATTSRNLMIAVLSACLLLGLNYVFYFFFYDNLLIIVPLALFNYIFAKILVILASLIVFPVGNRFRKRSIDQAKTMVENSDVVMIGVTGSFGKSSVKEFLYQILKEKYSVDRTSGNRNTDIGVALEIKEKLKSSLDFFICEMGAYKKGEINNICAFVRPRYGILTGIGNQHMDLFRSIENLVSAKSELIAALPEDGLGIVNADNTHKEKILSVANSRVVTYGWDGEADYSIDNVSYKGRLMFVEFTGLGKKYKFTTALLGEHQAVNLVGIVAMALELKISYEVIQGAIAKLEPITSKLSLHKGVNESTILNDGYNSNLHGFLSGLEVARKFNAERKYAFSYGIFELGDEKPEAYRKVVESIKEGKITLLTLDKGFLKFDSDNVLHFESESGVMDFLRNNLTKDDLFMLEGRCTNEFLEFLDLKPYEVQD